MGSFPHASDECTVYREKGRESSVSIRGECLGKMVCSVIKQRHSIDGESRTKTRKKTRGREMIKAKKRRDGDLA